MDSHDSPQHPDAAGHDARLMNRISRIAIVCVILAAFANAFRGDFVFDDIFEIEANPAVHRLWPPWEAMTVGNLVPARFLPSLSFAVDHALWGDSPCGYHFANIAIHLIAAIALFELARLTLASARLAARFGPNARPLALAIALVWAVHPLQTQSVTYVYQRIESMAAMFCLVSMACFARAASEGWRRGWLAASVAAAALAMASKENAVALPLILLTYDWTFVASSSADVWSRRGWHAAIAATTVIVGLQVWLQRSAYGEFDDAGPGSLAYALTQPGVILHYLQLAVWPFGLCLDYGWPIATSAAAIAVPLLAVLGLVVATAVGVWNRRPWAWLGCVFLLALAPTSSIMPVLAVAADHRMYLPLAAVIAAGVLSAATLLSKWRPAPSAAVVAVGRQPVPWIGAGLVAGLVVALGLLTHERNKVYADREAMWEDVLAKRPDNFCAHMWMAGFADRRGDSSAAIASARRAVQNRPRCNIFSQLSRARATQGDYDAAESFMRMGVDGIAEILPADDRSVLMAKCSLASLLSDRRRYAEAEAICRDIAADLEARCGKGNVATVRCRTLLAGAALRRGEPAAAASSARESLLAANEQLGAWHPMAQGAAIVLASALVAQRDAEGGIRVLNSTLEAVESVGWRRTVDATATRQALASILEESGRLDEAVAQRRRILDDCLGRGSADDLATRRATVSLTAAQGAAAKHHGFAADAERLFAEGVEIALSDLGPADSLTQSVAIRHAALQYTSGQVDSAERTLRAVLAAAEPWQGSVTAVEMTATMNALAGLLEQTDRIDEGLSLRRTILRAALDHYGSESEQAQRASRAVMSTIRARDSRKAAGSGSSASDAGTNP